MQSYHQPHAEQAAPPAPQRLSREEAVQRKAQRISEELEMNRMRCSDFVQRGLPEKITAKAPASYEWEDCGLQEA